MKKNEVKNKLKENNLSWDDFSDWMFGQTMGLTDDGELDYYYHDVERYINMKINNKPTYFD